MCRSSETPYFWGAGGRVRLVCERKPYVSGGSSAGGRVRLVPQRVPRRAVVDVHVSQVHDRLPTVRRRSDDGQTTVRQRSDEQGESEMIAICSLLFVPSPNILHTDRSYADEIGLNCGM